MNKARILVRRELVLCVGDTVHYHGKKARVLDISSSWLLLQVDGVKYHTSIEAFCVNHGQNFTLDVDVIEQ